jgi:hypothetical protein
MESKPSMSADDARELLCRAVRAMVSGEVGATSLFTEDVVVDSPNMHVISRVELEDQLSDRTGVLTNIALAFDEVEVLESGLVATWRMSGDHTGEVLFNDDELFEASGRHIHLEATSTAHLRGNLICALRTVYDDLDLYRQVSADPAPLTPPEGPAHEGD